MYRLTEICEYLLKLKAGILSFSFPWKGYQESVTKIILILMLVYKVQHSFFIIGPSHFALPSTVAGTNYYAEYIPQEHVHTIHLKGHHF